MDFDLSYNCRLWSHFNETNHFFEKMWFSPNFFEEKFSIFWKFPEIAIFAHFSSHFFKFGGLETLMVSLNHCDLQSLEHHVKWRNRKFSVHRVLPYFARQHSIKNLWKRLRFEWPMPVKITRSSQNASNNYHFRTFFISFF